jgi:hypothetical protein
MRWVTRKGVKFDRTACAWLIKRYIDPDAEFGYLTEEEMPAAIEAGANAFHNYKWTGSVDTLPTDRLNFPKLIEKYGYDKDPAMPLMAQTVRSAERQGFGKDGSEHYGIWAIANGIYALCNGDDACIVERMLPVYDALYAYCLARVNQQTGMVED